MTFTNPGGDGSGPAWLAQRRGAWAALSLALFIGVAWVAIVNLLLFPSNDALSGVLTIVGGTGILVLGARRLQAAYGNESLYDAWMRRRSK